MKNKFITALIWLALAAIVAAWTWFWEWLFPGTPFQSFLWSLLFYTPLTIYLFLCIKQLKWRYDNGVDLFATLETKQKNVKEHMLYIMQYGHVNGIVGALKEFNDIFRNYPQWELENWEVFRAWYKNEIDHMTSRPKIYHIKMKYSGEPYSKEADPLYDPNAPDWSIYDREHHYYDDDDDDYDDDDDDDYGNTDKQSKASDALAVGMGIGIVNGLTGGSVFGGGSGGN